MHKILDELRQEYSEEEAGRKWYQRRSKGDALLYLGARMRDAENAEKAAMALANATETAALKIIGQYDLDAASDFYAEVQLLKKRYLD